MKLRIVRGSKEIGGTCVELEHAGSRIVIDIGMPLGQKSGMEVGNSNDDFAAGREFELNGMLPNVPGLYPWHKEYSPIDGLLMSHAHMDHYGLYAFVNRSIPVWLGEGTRRLMNVTGFFTARPTRVENARPFQSGMPFSCGAFTVTPFLMDHSAFDAYAFLIEADGRKVLYSGDFRAHGRKRKAFYWFLHNAPKEVDALLLEGTMMGRTDEIVDGEEEIEERILSVLSETSGPVFFYSSGQNIDRIVSFYKAASAAKRLLVVDVYVAEVLDRLKTLAGIPHVGRDFGNIRVYYPDRLSRRIIAQGKGDMLKKFRSQEISLAEIMDRPAGIMMLVRGSMVEDFRSVGRIEGAALIYSMWDGYLKEESTKRLLDWAKDNGMTFYKIHTSGHADIPTLKRVIRAVQPKLVIPIHTEYPERYRILGRNIRMLSDGEILELS